MCERREERREFGGDIMWFALELESGVGGEAVDVTVDSLRGLG